MKLRVQWYGHAEESAVNSFIKIQFSALESRGILCVETLN